MNFVPQTCVAAVFLLSLMDVRSATHHVATHGDDRNPGTLKKPFASLDRARDAVRKLASRPLREPVTVIVRGGKFCLNTNLELTATDCGAFDTLPPRSVTGTRPPHSPIPSPGSTSP